MPKISALTSLAAGSVDTSADVLPIVDTSANETKKITVAALFNAGANAVTPTSGTMAVTGAQTVSGNLTSTGLTNNTTLGAPATSGSTRGNFARVVDAGGSRALDVGLSSSAAWLQSRDKNDYTINYDLLLQPNGGNLLVGIDNNTGYGGVHRISKNAGSTEGNGVLSIDGGNTMFYSAFFQAVANGGWNASDAAQLLGKNSVTSRSINAAGTINASGADAAEYERNGGLKIAKGQIVGFGPDGVLTDKFDSAIRFGVKSTDPHIVGGDTWGTEDEIGKRPDEPKFTPPEYTGRAKPEDLPEDATEAQTAQHASDMADWRTDQVEYKARYDTERNLFDTATYPEYLRAKAEFEDKLEAARQGVDRIAYCGKVPCNVANATPGDYIVAVNDGTGGIKGLPVRFPSFDQYRAAVGRVNRILPDGRAEIAVIVH